MQLRIEYVTNLIAQGHQRTVIQDDIQARWEIAPVTARLYIRKAQDRIAEMMKQERSKSVAKLILRYEYLYRESVERGELKTAKTVLDSMAKMLRADDAVEREREAIDVVTEYEIEDTY
jgi:predicted ATP-dependent Lon-type protease